jgi:putative endonuclease
MSKSSELGKLGEQTVADFLVSRGVVILDRNYRIRGGEIDIIGKSGDHIIFVEVKTRSADAYIDYGTALESIDFKKRRYLIRTAEYWIYTHKQHSDNYFRFDVAELNFRDGKLTKFNYIKSAFTK